MSILEQFSKLSSRAGDLSFNKLNREIPNLDGLTNVEVMCLIGNRLNGNIPDGIKGRQSRTNLFRSFFEEGNLELGGCLENYPCQKEIIIRGNKSFHSLGRQIFNVYIQGKLESEDFDIVQAAQGVEKVVVKEFKAVVKNKTLEVRFHWAGKGTTAIPSRGTYGLLISAISVESGFNA
ncbi:probable LRR receptor-like serine/threonine-protein kinase At1g53420 [Vitis riparia]|uniref:probable LRR receptor-like serine/threonine-protein kinase At1g53420 n=1 Tax=Vitis riparia TaxID=96939 RepID=UPI00155AAD4B|nr:probable LRR receptor-like serine/threonine-protein kinase At1g53420 [Vitis riparia]